MEGLGVDCPKQNVGIRQVGKISQECRGICGQQVCRNLRSMLRLSQAQPRQSEENEAGKGHEGDQNQSGPRDETHQGGVREKRVRFDEPSSAPASASDAAEDDGEGKTLERESSM